jgi:hypothetical protein
LLEGCPIVTPATRRPRDLIPHAPLLAGTEFGPRLSAAGALEAIARGLRRGGVRESDLCPLEVADEDCADVRDRLDAVGFDVRLHAARAVVIASARLDERTLAQSATFEIATRARQGGVPAYAVTADNALSTFDARVLDLQLIVCARGPRSLAAAGERLAAVL